MKKQIFSLLLVFCPMMFAVAQPQTQTQPQSQQQQKAEAQNLAMTKQIEEDMSTKSVIPIDAKARASDYLKAFDLLRREKTAAKVYFEIQGSEKITNIIDISVMPENTLVVFRFNTAQGVKLQVVPIENILGIYHTP